MSILNMPNDGLFNVLIVLTRAVVSFGAMKREDLLSACGKDLEVIDSRQLGQTLNRWTELAFFGVENGIVDIREPYRGQLGKTPDTAESFLPKVLREIVFAPSNNARFWETEDNKTADLSRGLSWILAQNVYTLDTGSHKKIGALEAAQVVDSTKCILQNDTRWNGLRTWMVYLGFAKSGAQVTLDPTDAVRNAIPEIFGSEETLPAPTFIQRVGKTLPVLDNGSYRRKVEAALNPQIWPPTPADCVSTSLSRAVQRLDRDGVIATDQKSDTKQGITLLGFDKSEWRTVTHIRRPRVQG